MASNVKSKLRIKDIQGQTRQLSVGQILHEAASSLGRGEHRSALLLLEQAVRLAPTVLDLRHRLGEAQAVNGQSTEAIENLQKVVEAAPANASFRLSLAEALRVSYPLEAAQQFVAAIESGSKEPRAYCDLASLLLDLRREEEAWKVCVLGLHACPDSFEILGNHAVACRRLGLYEEAVGACRQQRNQRPNDARVWTNLGNGLRDLGRLAESEDHLRRACSLDPQSASAHYNLALTLLLARKFQEGFREYEWRWKSAVLKNSQRTFSQPLWDGTPLAGQRLLLWPEQGAGDFIQFSRYIVPLANRGFAMTLEAPAALLRLAGWLAGDFQITEAASLAEFDVQCPLLSIPTKCGENGDAVPPPATFLVPEEARQPWALRLGSFAQKRVALVWAGTPTHINDRNRSLPLAAFEPLFQLTAIQFFSLQVGEASGQLSEVSFGHKLQDLAPYCTDYAETAAALTQLDLVITVDTSVAHLAGSLGVPTWLLLPFAPDWRWLLERADSPWYPSMRLFRQTTPRDWKGVVAAVASALADFWQPAAPALIAANSTDTERWSNSGNLNPGWNERARMAADFIPAGATVLDLGCGAMALEKFLPPGCSYLPCDLVPRDERTLVCNFNEQPVPRPPDVSHIAMLGVLEYIHDWRGFLRQLSALQLPIVFSYCATDFTAYLDRAALGWVNHLAIKDLVEGCNEAGLAVQTSLRVDNNQLILKATAERKRLPISRRVLVLSYNNAGNFGDRLGFHLINSLLPAHAEVHYCHFKPWDIPAGDFDLLILGIGNSLFESILTEELLSLVKRIPRSVGIFGTQYRQAINRARFSELLDNLSVWFARHEEDVLLYGKGRTNLIHLGDWLISAFPMAKWSRNETLKIGPEIWNDLPLDRTIQQIQAHRNVISERIHPLLCAFTSAERVAYTEQYEGSGGVASGKFRGMLMDIFGRTFPESNLFEVDRPAVAEYRAKVLRVMSGMPQLFAELLK